MTGEGMRMQAIFSGEFLSKFMEGHLTFSVQEHSESISIRRPHCSLIILPEVLFKELPMKCMSDAFPSNFHTVS